jgi:lipopolysaccharide heptosyltransferase II
MVGSATDRTPPTRIAALLPNWIGDAVMATPALRAVKRRFPAAALVGIARPAISELLQGVASLDGLSPLAAGSGIGRVRSLAQLLRAGRFDLVLHFTNSFATAAAAALAGVPERVGYVRRGRGMLLTRRLQPRREAGRFEPVPAVDYYLGLAAALGCPPEPPRLELATNAADEAAADRLWRGFGAGAARPTVVINNSGAFGEAKLWPEASVAALARRLVRELGHNVVLLAGPAEAAMASRVLAAAACEGIAGTVAGPSLGLSKAVVKRARLMVTTDSGPRHFAAAFGVPSVTLFGPTDPRWTDLHSARDRWVRLDLDCQPCQQRRCPLGHHNCMRMLGLDLVWEAIGEQLRGFPGA